MNYEYKDGKCVCPKCGHVSHFTDCDRVHINCPICTGRTGLGDVVAYALHCVGITPPRYNRMRRMIGLRKPCRCKERQAKLNRLLSWRRGNKRHFLI